MELADYDKRIGTVMAFELLGTSLIMVSFNTMAADNVLTNAIMYFVAVLLTI